MSRFWDSPEVVAASLFGIPRPVSTEGTYPAADGLDLMHHGNTDIDQTEWVYAEPPAPPAR